MYTSILRPQLLSALALLFVLAACGDVGDAPEAQTGSAVAVSGEQGTAWPLDTTRSEINWKAAKVTRAHDGGFHTFDGTLSVADGTVTRADIRIDTRSIWTDTERLTNHLKSPDFFEVEAYPEAHFVAEQFAPADTAGATHLVTGNLTMHGQTKSVTFPATIHLSDMMAHASADFIIDRTDWNINYTGKADDLVKNSVRMIFDVVATPMPHAEAPPTE